MVSTLGAWAAYSMSSESSAHDEIDFWLDYTRTVESGAGFKLIVTDYTYPNSGVPYSKSAANTLETGVAIMGPSRFPLTIAGYVNVSNDDGHNTYFQADYPAKAGEVDLDFFVGVAGGSTENPDYYGTDTFNAINTGLSAKKSIAVTDRFSVPLTGWLIYNPHAEIAYFVVGMSL